MEEVWCGGWTGALAVAQNTVYERAARTAAGQKEGSASAARIAGPRRARIGLGRRRHTQQARAEEGMRTVRGETALGGEWVGDASRRRVEKEARREKRLGSQESGNEREVRVGAGRPHYYYAHGARPESQTFAHGLGWRCQAPWGVLASCALLGRIARTQPCAGPFH